MRSRVLIQFPGLGGYMPGILARLDSDLEAARAVLTQVDQVAAEYRLDGVAGPLTDPNGPSIDELAEIPARLHLASFTSAYLLYDALRSKGFKDDVLLGHSTGEITALAAGGALSVSDAARVLCEREKALDDLGLLGGLVAVNTGRTRAEHLCRASGGWSLTVSLTNSPTQSVISGSAEDLPRCEAVARAASIQATRLLVRYPHHNSLLRPAALRVAEAAVDYGIKDPAVRIYSPILGRFVTSASDARHVVNWHLTDPVRYLEALRTLYDEHDIREVVEVGARSVLTESARETLPAEAKLLGPPPNMADTQEIIGFLLNGKDSGVPAARPIPLDQSMLKRDSAARKVAATPSIVDTATVSGGPVIPKHDELIAKLRRTFADAVGYPEDVFTDDAHLEADLGIASVKKTELLVNLLDEYQLQTPPADLRMRDYTTLPQLAGLIEMLAASDTP